MNNAQQIAQFTQMIDRLSRTYASLPNKAAVVAVNFSKERFRAQNWVDVRTEPWKKRKPPDKTPGRAILVKKAILKRDVRKIYANANAALIGTSTLTAGYAKAHNEGFKGQVNVAGHNRNRFIKTREAYTTKSGKARTRTRLGIDNSRGAIRVKAHTRKMNMPTRKFLGASSILNRQLERMITAELINAIKNT